MSSNIFHCATLEGGCVRKTAIVLGTLIAVVIAAVGIFAATFNVNRYRPTIQSELQNRLGRPVTVGEMHLGVFPPRFRVQDLAIADDSRFSPDAPFVKAQELDVSVKLLPLIHKKVEINSLSLQRPSVNLIKNQSGVWNFASLGHPEQTSSGQPAEPTQPRSQGNPAIQRPSNEPMPSQKPADGQPAASAERQFSVGELTIQDGQISLLDQAKSKTPSLYDHIDVTLNNFAPNRPFTIDAAVHMVGAGAQEIRLQGEGGPLVQEEPIKTSFHGDLDIQQVGVSDLSKFLNSPALNGTDGILTGKTKISNDSGKVTAQGETNVQNGKVHGMELGYPISAQYDVTDDLAVDTIAIRKFALKLGSMPLEMSGTVNVKPTPAQVDLNVRATNVSIAEAAKLAAASGVALSQGTVVTGNVNVNIQARGPADKPALSGTITASNVQASGKEIAQPVQIQSVNLNLTPAEVRSNPFNVVSGGTTLNTQFSLRNYMSPTPMVDATVRAPNAQLPAILAMAKAYGVTSLDKVNGAGTLNLDMHAAGPIKSITAAEIMKALNGNMNLDFSNVKYSGADISHELASIAGFLNTNSNAQTSQGFTNILKMTGHILVKNGIAQTNDLQAQLDMGSVGAVGTADLASEALNIRVTAVLSQASSQRVGGQNVGGFLKTALANSQGELVIPALVTGTFSKPRFEPDIQQLAQMKLKGLVPNLSNPASIAGTLQNLLGGPKNPTEGQQQTQQQQQQQQPNPVEQVLGLFGKKKQQNQKPPPK
jgi:AsmA protein